MALFRCTSIASGGGKTVTEMIEAHSESAAAGILERRGRVPVQISAAAGGTHGAGAGGSVDAGGGGSAGGSGRGIEKPLHSLGHKQVLELTQSLSMLMSSGLSTRDALEIAGSVVSQRLRPVIAGMREVIRAGGSFSDAVRRIGGAFPPVYHGLIRIGEQVGSIDSVMQELTEYLQENARLRDRVRGAMVYPALVLAITLLGLTALVVFLLPAMETMFAQIGNQGSALSGVAARFRIGMAGLLSLVLLSVAAALARARQKRSNPDAWPALDRFLLGIPLFGRFSLDRELQGWAFAMETLTRNGIPVEQALQHSLTSVGSAALRRDLHTAQQQIVKGSSMSDAFRHANSMPPHVVRWISIGERAGQVEGVFKQLRQYYTAETEKRALLFMNLAEPALIVLVGALLITIIGMFVLPVFSLYGEVI